MNHYIIKSKSGRYCMTVILLLMIFLMVPKKETYAFTAWSKENGIWVNEKGEAIPGAVKKGIDVSYHQGVIDWDKVKATDIQFVIIRCGYGQNEENQDDTQWIRNVEACERLGIPYGVYLYSYADTIEKAKGEAQHVLRLLQGRKLSYPVYYDIEDRSLLHLTPSEHAQIAKAFCSVIEAKGYETGIHSYKNWFEVKLIDSFFQTRSKWVAQYSSTCGYEGNYRMWQCTDAGRVDGISGKVDVDFWLDSKPQMTSMSVKNLSYQSQQIAWKKSSGVSGYEVFRSTKENGTYKMIKRVASGVASLRVSAVTGRAYYYKVRAFKQVNGTRWYGSFSNIKGAKTSLSKTALVSIKRSSAKKITVKWKKVDGASGYMIYRSTKKGSGYKKIATVKKGTSISAKISVQKGKKYYYKIRAYRRASGVTSYGGYSSAKNCK